MSGMKKKVIKSDAEWRAHLSPEAYRVMRKQGTEHPGSSPLNHVISSGRFHCAGCGSPLFDSATKYESGSGWPSFYAPISEDAVSTQTDNSYFMTRNEVHCSHCKGHLGHVFPDGPQPTGMRYCMNGVALEFIPETE
ncbi:MAG: peptide-methionine (R)-S-oxide reductase MsrB [Alphaproteobacteria bacterium]